MPELGDMLESVLTRVGVTKERVTRWLGRPCKCRERQEKLNQLGRWMASLVSGKLEEGEAKGHLERMTEE
jgi:hypothetical protein